tara:strand:+ start:627 stop:1454 length:828 start_codon:yes stop_codon:yes gene_type:complete
MSKRVASIILNRNLPEVTNKLVCHLKKYDKNETDIYVVEAGSDPGNLSKYVTWYANWDDAIRKGLRYARGMNFGLSQLWNENKFENYDAFLLLTNDTELQKKSSIKTLLNIFDNHPRLGILSPCSKTWGERFLLKNQDTKYFWFIHNNAYFFRKEFIKDICITEEINYMNFLFDGTNFRGYGLEHEIIAKAYANNWAAGITNSVLASENESHLLNKSDLIKTEPFNINLKLYIEEGSKWMKKKYGFKSHWALQQYSKNLYDAFFDLHPEYEKYRL